MGIQFVPQYGFPILLDAEGPRIVPRESRWPSGWWILPALIVGSVECVAIIGWIVA
jgi:hypothetical protein